MILLWLCAPLQAAAPVILILGDSLSSAYGIDQEQGWVNLLQSKLQQEGYPHQVVNASIAGETTAGGLARIDALLDRNKPELVVVELGGNDGLRGLTLEQMQQNLTDIIQHIDAAKAGTLLAEIYLPPNYGAAYTQQFREVFHELAGEESVTLLPFLLSEVAANAEYMQYDGVHPNMAAQPVILDNVWRSLQPLLSQ